MMGQLTIKLLKRKIYPFNLIFLPGIQWIMSPLQISEGSNENCFTNHEAVLCKV
jgi:hypothetical protein